MLYAASCLLPILIRQKTPAKEPANSHLEFGLSIIELQIRDAAISMADKLAEDLPNMLEEYRAIIAALNELKSCSAPENKKEQVHFAEKLALHAKTEEDILYPATILIGDYLKGNHTVH